MCDMQTNVSVMMIELALNYLKIYFPYFIFGSIFSFAVWWKRRVERIRSQYVNVENGIFIPGSDNLPFVDYFMYGFTERNISAPFGDFEMSFSIGIPIVLVSEPIIIKEILKSKASEFDKGELTIAGVELIAGRENLFSADGAVWQHQRLMIDPAFRPAFMQLLSGAVITTVQSTIKSWKHKGSVPSDLTAELSNVSLNIICSVAFGLNKSENEGQTIQNHPIVESYKTILNYCMMNMMGLKFFASKKAQEAATNHIESVAKSVLERRRQSSDHNNLIASTLIDLLDVDHSSTDEGDSSNAEIAAAGKRAKKLTDRQIIDNIKIFLFAGHDSTTSTMLWVLYLLALHPSIQQKVHEEAAQAIPDPSLVTFEQLKGLTYLRCVMKETLRLYPPAWAINRSPKQDVTVAGFHIPKGASIMINTLRLHRREDLGWEKPLEFLPERWMEENERSHQSKASFCYLPFGGGSRSCVGQPLAEMEMLAVLALTLLEFSATLVQVGGRKNDQSIDFFCGATIRPKHVKNLRLVPR